MGWKHQCTCPGNFRIWLRQARSGAIWSCRCGTFWELRRRSLIPGHSHWEWTLVHDEPEAPQPEGTHAQVELSHPDAVRDDSERCIPDVRLGFQMEPR